VVVVEVLQPGVHRRMLLHLSIPSFAFLLVELLPPATYMPLMLLVHPVFGCKPCP